MINNYIGGIPIEEKLDIFEQYKQSGDIDEYKKDLGEENDSVKRVYLKNKVYAGKIIKNEISKEEKIRKQLRGENILRIRKLFEPKEINGNTYHLVTMEEAVLRTLKIINHYFREYNLLKLI